MMYTYVGANFEFKSDTCDAKKFSVFFEPCVYQKDSWRFAEECTCGAERDVTWFTEIEIGFKRLASFLK